MLIGMANAATPVLYVSTIVTVYAVKLDAPRRVMAPHDINAKPVPPSEGEMVELYCPLPPPVMTGAEIQTDVALGAIQYVPCA